VADKNMTFIRRQAVFLRGGPGAWVGILGATGPSDLFQSNGWGSALSSADG
jgi:hypothetical protein